MTARSSADSSAFKRGDVSALSRRLPGMVFAVSLSALFLLTACQERRAGQTLRIFAASSLQESFHELAARFERDNPEIHVQLNFGGSQVLRVQLEQGARADLFASANAEHAMALSAAGVLEQAQPFAENELVVIVPKDNPARLATFRDLSRAPRIVMGTEAVPIGKYSRVVLKRAAERFGSEFVTRVNERVVSEESNVRLVRAKVEFGEVDAAIVYGTDAVASVRVSAIAIPEDINATVEYLIGHTTRSKNVQAARAFVTFLRSPTAQVILERRGFLVEAM